MPNIFAYRGSSIWQLSGCKLFKGYHDYTIQYLIIQPYNTRYRLEQWQAPSGAYVIASVPNEVKGRHYGTTLISFILHQYYNQHVTQPLLLEQLRELGIEISSGQLSRILTERHESFHHPNRGSL